MWPVANFPSKSMMNWIAMDVGDDCAQIFVIVNLFSFEVGHEETTTAVVVFVERFGVAVK